jgi:hypothetical protein
MKRTLTSRGLAVVFACLGLVAVATAPASAAVSGPNPRHLVVATGTWSSPAPSIVDVTSQGNKYLIDLAGSTTTVGDFVGQSTYTMRLLFDPPTLSSSGTLHETFSATLPHRGSGRLTFSEYTTIQPDGSLVVAGSVVSGTGVFLGAHGFVLFTGTTDPSGPSPSAGSYVMALDLAR